MVSTVVWWIQLLWTVVSLGFGIVNMVVVNGSFSGTSCSMSSGLSLNTFLLIQGIVSLSSFGLCLCCLYVFGVIMILFLDERDELLKERASSWNGKINLIVSVGFLVAKFVLLIFGSILLESYCSRLGWITTYSWCFLFIDFSVVVLNVMVSSCVVGKKETDFIV